MKYLSDRMTHASGSIGGTTFAHNRGGLYTRARRKPVNPQSAFQTVIRNGLATLQATFPGISPTFQAGWKVWADNMVFPSVLGGITIRYTAQQCFVMMNNYRIQAGLSVILTPPTIFAMADLTPPTATIAAGGTTGDIAYTNTDQWATEVGGALLVYASPPQNGTVNFYKRTFRFAGSVLGAAMAPTSPATLTLPFVVGPNGSKMYFRAVSVLADGRVSSPFPLVATA